MSEIHDEVVERLRQHGEAIASDRDRLFKELTEARARIQALEERLEMTHVWTCKADKPEELVRAEIPPEERVIGQADAVDCRDETIKLLDARIERQVRRIAGQTMRIAELERMGAPGQLTGMKDKHGTEIRIGDTLRFDFNEWNRSELNMARWCGREPDPAKLEECVFVMEYKDGALCHPGGTHELGTYCEIIETVKP